METRGGLKTKATMWRKGSETGLGSSLVFLRPTLGYPSPSLSETPLGLWIRVRGDTRWVWSGTVRPASALRDMMIAKAKLLWPFGFRKKSLV